MQFLKDSHGKVFHLSGIAAVTGGEMPYQGGTGGRPFMFSPGAFTDCELDGTPVCVEHITSMRLGHIGANVRAWWDGPRLRYEVKLLDNEAGQAALVLTRARELRGSSIAFKGSAIPRNNWDEVYVVNEIQEFGPVEDPGNWRCGGVTLNTGSSFPEQWIDGIDQPKARRTEALLASGKRGRRVRPMILPPPPKAMVDGSRLAAAAAAGEGCAVRGMQLSASSVQRMVRNAMQARAGRVR